MMPLPSIDFIKGASGKSGRTANSHPERRVIPKNEASKIRTIFSSDWVGYLAQIIAAETA
jgi:hypothetical protein